MPQYRKPIPKTQKEISKSQQEPYSDSEGKFIGQNPNFPINPNQEQSGISFNRAEKTSFKNDSSKIQAISIQDIDEAIMYYFKDVIRASVEQNGTRIEVPVIYGAPERWKSAQRDGFFRDKKGAILFPLIMFKRTSVRKNPNIANKLDANNPNIYTFTQKEYSTRNFYSNFDALNNRKQQKVRHAIVVPDYIDLVYDCAVQTYYVEQLNKIVEDINYASHSYWGRPERFKFITSIDRFDITTELQNGKERAVKATFSLNLKGYLIPDNIQKDTSAIKKYSEKSSVTFSTEAVRDINNIN